MEEPDRSQESKRSGDQKSERGPKSQGAIEDKEDGGFSLFLHQIIDFASVHFALARNRTCTACILAAPPTQSLTLSHWIVGVRPGTYIAKLEMLLS